ncbi:MAG: nicotinamide mononucleotide transporter [Oscillospiraceae bacterium]|nr:nicotinamide mononucleotide transporter [Oscillospiraceae bacterium]
MKKLTEYFSKTEIALWSVSGVMIISSFFIFDRENYMTLIASLIGITSLIFAAKGNPVSQILMIIFSLMYGAISFTFSYYGEMITYLGMTLPMSVTALVSWLKNPYEKGEKEVKVNTSFSKKEILFMIFLTLAVTLVFYFILKELKTSNLIPSTISVATSFAAVYLTFRRSPYFALLYAMNDIVLIILWILASIHDTSYISVVVCFMAFLANDIYGFISWRRMEKRQKKTTVN